MGLCVVREVCVYDEIFSKGSFLTALGHVRYAREDDHGVADQDDGAALVADVAIAFSPSQFHLAISQTATYSATPNPHPTKASWRLPLSTPSGRSYPPLQVNGGLMLWGV